MSIATFEAVVEHGQIRLKTDVQLPEGAVVYVVVPSVRIERSYISTPRLLHQSQAADFKLEVVEDSGNASV